ncbi:MAG: type II toxin-antitoxin system VapC family toxin [Methylococcales bacterium]|nr:type II toxin-antitoxin system VapC family toxin [Methylococcales bacterium]
MLTICDTHILLFWADNPARLSEKARSALDMGNLACADISLWEIAMLYARGRINNHAGVTATAYIEDILLALDVSVLPITPAIAELAQSDLFIHGDPADRLIGATALFHRAALITADEKLRAIPKLRCIW